MLRHLDLFSGIGGFALAAQWVGGYETVAFCEIDAYCQAVLRKHWPRVPVYDDVRKLSARDISVWIRDTLRDVDVISGGYPCQPFSLAGKRDGSADDRHLWPEFARLVSEIRPTWVLAENVAGHVSMGLDQVLSDLEGIGYSWRPFIVPACAVDANHRRDRIWIVAHSGHASRRAHVAQHGDARTQRLRSERGEAHDLVRTCGEDVADTCCTRLSEPAQPGLRIVRDQAGPPSGREFSGGTPAPRRTWATEPDVGRVAHGIPARVDRLRGLGNSIVPQVAAIFLQAIKDCPR